MKKNTINVRELVQRYQANCDRISEIADACETEQRERNEAETKEFEALSRENQLLSMRIQAAAAENLRENVPGKDMDTQVRELLYSGKIATIRLLQIMKALNTLNTLYSLFPVYIAMGLPTAVFILTEFIHGLRGELYEAGYIDGAGRFRIWYQIVVPLIKPALATVAIYNLVPIWNDLWFPLIFITKESSKTVLLAVTRLQGQYTTDWPKVLTILTLSALPVILLYLTMSQSFIKGLTAGAVKG